LPKYAIAYAIAYSHITSIPSQCFYDKQHVCAYLQSFLRCKSQ